MVFATLYIFSLLGLVVQLISDLTYTWIDPRIDFEVAGGLMDQKTDQDRHRDEGVFETIAAQPGEAPPPPPRMLLLAVADQPPPLAELQSQPARLLVACGSSWSSSS